MVSICLMKIKDLPRRTTSNKVLHDKTFSIAKNPKYDGYQCGLASMVYNFFDKKSLGSDTSGGTNERKIISIQGLSEELPKRIIAKFEKRNMHSSFIGNIWGAYLVGMQLISNFNKKIFIFIVC